MDAITMESEIYDDVVDDVVDDVDYVYDGW